jgi:diacylglycerol kinase family enzyme
MPHFAEIKMLHEKDRTASLKANPVQPQTSRRPQFVALVNARAGEVLQRGQPKFRDMMIQTFDGFGISCVVHFMHPRKLAQAVTRALDSQPDALLIAGGDGTINRLLPQLAAAEMPVGLVPLGTLNLLARDLGLEGAMEHILLQLARLNTEMIDLGEVNGRLFHSNAGLGFFARMAREREDAREVVPFSKMLGFSLATLRSLWGHRPITVEMTINGTVETYVADALLVTNNQFHGSGWRRDRLDGGKLEVHMLHAAGIWARLKAAIAVYRGTWRQLPYLDSLTATRLTVNRRGRTRSTLSLDGEVCHVRNPIMFRSRPAAIELIAAPISDGKR